MATDPGYAEGLRAAVAASLEHGLATVEAGDDRPPPVPAALLLQARIAARNGISLETVLRRYFAGYTLLGDFLIEEAESLDLDSAELKPPLRALAILFDQLTVAVSEEHGRELDARPGTGEARRAERVRQLLAGEMADPADLAYVLDRFHIGLIAVGEGAGEAIRSRAAALDQQILLVVVEQATWAWLGSRRCPDREDLESLLADGWPAGLAVAIGEPAEGLAGWRLTHCQAKAALPIAQRQATAVRYADVALLASVVQDETLASSLRRLYIEPLEEVAGGRETLLHTLRAYFRAGHNVSSAAMALGVKRHTVTNRLRGAEEAICRPLDACAAELELSLRMAELERLEAPAPASMA